MHARYGPIVAIGPHELHIHDPDFYDELYAGNARRRNKWPRFVAQLGANESALSTIEHETHRMRRAALNPFFSKTAVRKLQPIIDDILHRLLGRFEQFRETGQPMTVSLAFAAFTSGKALARSAAPVASSA
jgi:cytochrome P450